MKRRCAAAAMVVAALSLAIPATGSADPDVYTEQDRTFITLLEKRGTLFNFRLQRDQAKRACEDLSYGERPMDAVKRLMDLGAYSFDVAKTIVVAGSVAYCPWISWAT